MEFIHTATSAQSAGHYTPAVIHNQIAYISGQLPVNYEQKDARPSGTLAEQTQLALRNLETVLRLCKSNKDAVIKTTVYIPDIAYWSEINQIYADFFGAHKPARTIVPTSRLHFGALIEIEAIAAVTEDKSPENR